MELLQKAECDLGSRQCSTKQLVLTFAGRRLAAFSELRSYAATKAVSVLNDAGLVLQKAV